MLGFKWNDVSKMGPVFGKLMNVVATTKYTCLFCHMWMILDKYDIFKSWNMDDSIP